MNRRVFAYVDTGIADGVQLDSDGNIYASCGDGVHVGILIVFRKAKAKLGFDQVWDTTGTLLGKFFIGTVTSNLIFAGKGRLVILAETAIYLAEIQAGGFSLAFP